MSVSLRRGRRLVVAALALFLLAVVAVGALATLDAAAPLRAAAREALLERLTPPKEPPERPSRVRRVELFTAAPTAGADVRLLAAALDTTDDVQTVTIGLDGQTRRAVAGVAPFSFRVALTLPDRPELWLSLNHEGHDLAVEGLVHRARLVHEGSETVLVDRFVPSYRHGWQQLTVPLDAFAGREVELEFETTLAGDARPGDSAPLRGLWGDLVVRSRATTDPPPNLVVVLLDTLRADHLGCYGYDRPTSPHIDRLARSGVRFENVFSSAPWTDPSILSLMTGELPSDVWEPLKHSEAVRVALPSSAHTLAELLQAAGYFTIAASDHPGINAGRFGQGFDVYRSLPYGDGAYTGWRETEPAKVLERIDELLDGRTTGPTFLYVHLIYPHEPYIPPPEYAALFGPVTDVIDEAQRDAVVNAYDADIRMTDDVVARLLELLDRRGLGGDTVLALLSDHGEAFWEHGLPGHGNSYYNELLRIPLIVRATGRIEPGRVESAPGRMIDVMPTLLDLLDVTAPEHLRGRSLLEPPADGEEILALSEFANTRVIFGKAIQSPSRKLIIDDPEAADRLLFALTDDPDELSPIEDPEAAAALEATIEQLRTAAAARRQTHTVEEDEPTEEMLERLKALGYVD